MQVDPSDTNFPRILTIFGNFFSDIFKSIGFNGVPSLMEADLHLMSPWRDETALFIMPEIDTFVIVCWGLQTTFLAISFLFLLYFGLEILGLFFSI